MGGISKTITKPKIQNPKHVVYSGDFAYTYVTFKLHTDPKPIMDSRKCHRPLILNPTRVI